uniref:hypothetical protein n=1 Tax=Nonomuraea sp. CA-251285 TaxID=3240002 RepID=UPI003F4951FC
MTTPFNLSAVPAPNIVIYLLPAPSPDEFWVMLAAKDSGDGAATRVGRISLRHDNTWGVVVDDNQAKIGKARSQSDAMRACAVAVLAPSVMLEPLD